MSAFLALAVVGWDGADESELIFDICSDLAVVVPCVEAGSD